MNPAARRTESSAGRFYCASPNTRGSRNRCRNRKRSRCLRRIAGSPGLVHRISRPINPADGFSQTTVLHGPEFHDVPVRWPASVSNHRVVVCHPCRTAGRRMCSKFCRAGHRAEERSASTISRKLRGASASTVRYGVPLSFIPSRRVAQQMSHPTDGQKRSLLMKLRFGARIASSWTASFRGNLIHIESRRR